MGRLEDLKQKYQSVLRVIEQDQIRLEHLHVQGNKLFLQGVAPSVEAKNKVWDQIKLVSPQQDDIIADISVSEARTQAAAAPGGQSGRSYTVQAGDTLSKISKEFYGDASQYMRIFEANRDKLKDPDKIQVGQVLAIPSV